MSVRTFHGWSAFIGAAAALFFLACHQTSATAIAVTPVQLYLTRGNSSTDLTITNRSSQPIRFSVSGYSWAQKPSKPVLLRSTTELVFFPALFSLSAGEQRHVRIGTTAEASSVETAYRIIVEELPPLSSVLENRTGGAGLTIRTRVNLPLFLEPAHQTPRAQFEYLQLRDGALHFSVVNNGNVHLQLQEILVDAFDHQGRKVYTTTLNGWYVLPGATLGFRVRIPKGYCHAISRFILRFTAEQLSVNQAFDRINGGCSAVAWL